MFSQYFNRINTLRGVLNFKLWTAKNVNISWNSEFIHPLYRSYTKVPLADSSPPESSDSRENLWDTIDHNLKQFKKTNFNIINICLNELKHGNVEDLKDKCLLLLQTCNEHSPNILPQIRNNLAEEIWNLLEKHKINLDVRFYEALLNCYLDNNYNLDARLFLKKMKDKGIEPSENVFQLALQCVCNQGSVGQAAYVISAMKGRGYSANESVFSSLIVGHNKAKDLKEAESILETMEAAHITPGTLTYLSLLRGAAETGDYNKLQTYLNKATSLGITFTDSQLLNIIKYLATSGNEMYIATIIKSLPRNDPKFVAKVENLITQLVYLELEEVAYKLLQLLPPLNPQDDLTSFASFYIRDIVLANRPLSSLISICDQLILEKRNEFSLHKALECCLHSCKIEESLLLLEKLQERNYPIREHYFWPLLLHSAKANGQSGVLDILRKMIQFKVPIHEETFLDYVLPALILEEPLSILNRVKDITNLHYSKLVFPFVAYFLKCGDWNKALTIATKYHSSCDSNLLRPFIIQCYGISSNHIKLVQLISLWKKLDVSLLIINMVISKKLDVKCEELLNILLELKANNLQISEEAKDVIIDVITTRDHDEESKKQIKTLLPSLTLGSITNMDHYVSRIPHPRDMTLEQLECHLIELEGRNMNTRGVLRRLLQIYCRLGNVVKATSTLSKLKSKDFKFSPGMKASLLDLYLKGGNLEDSLTQYQELVKNYPYFNVDPYKILKLATLLVKHGKINECKQLIEAHKYETVLPDANSMTKECWSLLKAVSENADSKTIQDVLDLLVWGKYIEMNNIVLGPLVKSYLARQDLQGAVKEFHNCVEKYNKTPLLMELMIEILRTEDVERENWLKTVVDASKFVHGSENTIVNLIFALACSGNTQNLRKFLLENNCVIPKQLLDHHCQRLVQSRSSSALITLIEAAKDLSHLDINVLILNALKIFHSTGDYNGAMSLWSKLEEMNIKPNQEFHTSMAALLESTNKSKS